MISRRLLSVLFTVSALLCAIPAESAPPIPARIGGEVIVDGDKLTRATDEGFAFMVLKTNGKEYKPAASDEDGLNSSDWYIIDIPVASSNGQDGGAKPGDIAIIRVFKNGEALTVESPDEGKFTVGSGGSTTKIKLIVNTK